VSEVHIASIIALMMEAVCNREMSVYCNETTRHYNPVDSKLHTHCRENLKSHMNCLIVLVYVILDVG
jgi:hypothetical protein